MKKARVLLAAESLTAGNGGICRVARLMSKVLAEQCDAGGIAAGAVVLNGPAVPAGDGLAIATAGGSRLQFCLRVHAAAINRSHFIYDFAGMARAHCRLPGLKRPSLAYLHGIEVWEDCARHYVRAARRADFLLSNSEYTRQRAERAHGGFARAKVCWLATESDDVPASVAVTSGPPTVLILGRIDDARYKGHDELIACWPEVVSAVPDARLLVVGGGPQLEPAKKRTARSPAARNIEFRGFIEDRLMGAVWAESSVFAMPSRGEGFGLVYIEAMRHGIPVIASIHDAASELNVDGRTGYNVDLQRPEELPERIIALLKDRDHAACLGLNGRRRWAENFTFSAFPSPAYTFASRVSGRIAMITHITPYMHHAGGGPPVVVDRLCSTLAERGWKCRVVTTDTLARGLPPDWTAQYGRGYDFTVLTSRGPAGFAYGPRLAATIDAAVAESRLVHVHTLWSYPGWTAMRSCRRRGVPFVVMPHGMLDPNSLGRKWLKKQLYGRFVEWPQLRAAAAVVYTHEEERRLAESAVRRLPPGFIVPLGADRPPDCSRDELANRFRQRYPDLGCQKLVLFLSRLHPKKGLDLLIPAFRAVAACHANAHLLVVGPGDDEYIAALRRQVQADGLADRATFTGPMSGDSKWEAMAAAAMLVLPSYQENFALVVAEAMRAGLPVVLSRRVNIWSDVIEAGAGVACELTVDSVADAITHFLANPAMMERAGCLGRQMANERFDWNHAAAATEAVYQYVLSDSKHSRQRV